MGARMDVLRWQGMVTGSDQSLTTGIRDLQLMKLNGEVYVVGCSGVTGGLISFELRDGAPPTQVDSAYAPSGTTLSGSFSGQLTQITLGGQHYFVTGAEADGGLIAYSMTDAGTLGPTQLLKDLVAEAAGAVSLASTSNGLIWLAGSDIDGGYIRAFTSNGSAAYKSGPLIRDTDDNYVSRPVALETVRLGSKDYLLVLSGNETGVSVFEVTDNNGGLTQTDAIGIREGLGLLSAPQAMEVIMAHDAAYVIVASDTAQGNSGALSVMRLEPDGTLRTTDHLLDSLTTRFGDVQALSVVENGDWIYVAAAGGDGGLSLFTLMPDGSLQHLDTVVHQTGQALMGLSAMTAAVVGDNLQIITASEDTPGLGQINFSLADQGGVHRAVTTGGMLIGGAFDDLMVGNAGNDLLQGGAGDDILRDGAGRDTLEGGSGADTYILHADGETDRINGFQFGIDQLDLSHLPMLYDYDQLEIIVTSWGAQMLWQDEQLDIFSANGQGLSPDQVVSSITPTPVRPPLVLGENPLPQDPPPPPPPPTNQVLEGGGGADTLMGGAGNDILLGGGGDNSLYGGDGNDELRGLDGNDIAVGGRGRDRAYLGAGDDIYEDDDETGFAGSDLIYVGEGNDTVRGQGGNDTIHGMNGADRLWGGLGNDTIYAGVGHDQVWGGIGNDELWAGIGHDTIWGEDGNDEIFGLSGFDLISGGTGNDTLWGGDGWDTVTGGTGRDLAFLGAGADIYNDNATESGFAGGDTVFLGLGHDTAYGAGGDDIFHGMAGNDLLEGGVGHDTIYAGTDADTVMGGAGDDELWGGPGNDLVVGGTGADLAFLGPGADVFQDEVGESGSTGGDEVFLGLGNDTALGAGGDDIFHGMDGNDLLEGGVGNDTLYGGVNNDTLIGGAGNDRVEGGMGADLAELGLGDDLFIDVNQGGELGRDTVFAGAGNDTIQGWGGDDVFDGEAGNDIIMAGWGMDTLTGGDGADTLNGEDGHDVLIGGSGSDRLEGGRGLDTLTGGAGEDTFVFSAPGGLDRITDFTPGEDLLELANVSSLDDLTISDWPAGLHLDWDGGSVVLEGIVRAVFDTDDILFL